MNFFKKIKEGLSKTRQSLVGSIREVVGEAKLDEEALEDLEEVLISADLGVETSGQLADRMRKRALREAMTGDDVLKALREELAELIDETKLGGDAYKPRDASEVDGPYVTFVVGVNGTGKTTSIGKLAARYAEAGRKTLIIAADTFRSAAVEQVAIWAERANVELVRGATGADPASVVYDGLEAAKARGIERVLVDTAGRLHTKTNLMAELEKIDRVAKKVIPDAPHDVLLVLDGTTGQNGLAQAKKFRESIGVSALIVTKLDGTAKGGMLVPIVRELNIPVRWIGVGEQIDDLVPFKAELIVDAVFGEEETGFLQGSLEEAAKRAEEAKTDWSDFDAIP